MRIFFLIQWRTWPLTFVLKFFCWKFSWTSTHLHTRVFKVFLMLLVLNWEKMSQTILSIIKYYIVELFISTDARFFLFETHKFQIQYSLIKYQQFLTRIFFRRVQLHFHLPKLLLDSISGFYEWWLSPKVCIKWYSLNLLLVIISEPLVYMYEKKTFYVSLYLITFWSLFLMYLYDVCLKRLQKTRHNIWRSRSALSYKQIWTFTIFKRNLSPCCKLRLVALKTHKNDK